MNLYACYFVFDLGPVTDTVACATLTAWATVSSPDPEESFTLYDMTSPIDDVVANHAVDDGGLRPDIYLDLRTGIAYGTSTARGQGYVNLRLNAKAIAAINANRGQLWGMGGFLNTWRSSLDGEEGIWFSSVSLTLDTQGGPFAFTDWDTIGEGSFLYVQGATPGNLSHSGSQALGIQHPTSFIAGGYNTSLVPAGSCQTCGIGSRSGSQSLAIQNSPPFIAGWYNTNYVPVCARKTYEIGACVRRVDFDTNDFVAIYVEQYDSLGFPLDIICLPGPSGSTNWIQTSNIFTITDPSVATIRAFLLFGRGDGMPTMAQALYDDITLSEVSSPPTITEIDSSTNNLSLSVSGCALGSSNSVQRTCDLQSANWTNIAIFSGASTAITFSEPVIDSWLQAFYRVESMPTNLITNPGLEY